MASDPLIFAQLQTLQRRLPADQFDELADGLEETYQAHLRQAADPVTAARRAIAEFGDADTVTAAICRAAAWRRGATALLLTGPVLGSIWAATLLTQQAWSWSLPMPARLFAGIALLATIALLLTAHRERRTYRRGQLAAILAFAALIVLDTAACLVVIRHTPHATPVLLAALAASVLRAAAALTLSARHVARTVG